MTNEPTLSDDLVERVAPLNLADYDHARGCEGREYTCDCGYDEQVEAALRERAGLASEVQRLREEIARLTEEGSALAAGSCVHPELLIGDEHGHFDCGIAHSRAEVIRWASKYDEAVAEFEAAETKLWNKHAELVAAQAEIARLRARLEIPEPPFEHLDGIECRDETIRQLDSKMEEMADEIARLKALLAEKDAV